MENEHLKFTKPTVMTDAIVFKNISLGYVNQTVTLKELNLNIKAGSFHYLTGSSGAGKSLMIKSIYAQVLPLSGQLTVLNRSINSFNLKMVSSLRQRIGVVLQDFRLIDNLSLIENVALPLHIQGMKRD